MKIIYLVLNTLILTKPVSESKVDSGQFIIHTISFSGAFHFTSTSGEERISKINHCIFSG